MNVGDLVICPANELNHGLATPSYLGVVLTVWGAMAEVAGGRDRYAKFGVVIGVKAYETTVHGRPDCYEVQWINGKTTNEHECYLKEVSIDNL